MISFIMRTDVHINENPPQSRVDDYMETCFRKLKQVGDLARKHKVTAVLDNGDFFHNKAATKNSHALVKRVMDHHKEHYPCPVYLNPGNHDFPYANVDYVDKQPLGVLFAAGTFIRMDDITFEEEGLKVRLVGLPFKVDFTVEDFNIERGDEDVLLILAHTFASKKGGDLFGNEVAQSYYDLMNFGTADLYGFGHWHIDQGIETLGGKKFVNLGSLTRGSLVKDNLTRVPRVAHIKIYRDDAGLVHIEADALEIEVAPASEVFDLERHERLKVEDRDIDSFIATLTKAGSEEESSDLEGAISGLTEYQDDVRKRALYYLDQASK